MSTTVINTKYEVIKETKYLRFIKLERPPTKKTDIILIDSISHNITLGRIMWHAPWRQYCFFPDNNTLWNVGCMEDVYEVMVILKEEKKEFNEKV